MINSTLDITAETLTNDDINLIKNHLDKEIKRLRCKAIPSPTIYSGLLSFFKDKIELNCFNRALSLAIKAGRLPGVKSFIGRSGGIGFEDTSHVVIKPIIKEKPIKQEENTSSSAEVEKILPNIEKNLPKEEIVIENIAKEEIVSNITETNEEDLSSEEEKINEFVKKQNSIKEKEIKNLNELTKVYTSNKVETELWISGRRFLCPLSTQKVLTILVNVFEATEDENGNISLGDKKYSCLEPKISQYFDNLLFYVYEAAIRIPEETHVKSA